MVRALYVLLAHMRPSLFATKKCFGQYVPPVLLQRRVFMHLCCAPLGGVFVPFVVLPIIAVYMFPGLFQRTPNLRRTSVVNLSIYSICIAIDTRHAVLTGGGAKARDREADTRLQQPLLDVQFECELCSVRSVQDRQDSDGAAWPVWAMLTNGTDVGCDFVVSATGVKPNTDVLGSDFEVRVT